MKYKINTYKDFLNLTPKEITKIIDDDFDLYTESEFHLLMEFIDKFNNEIYNITHTNISLNSLTIESKSINIVNCTNGELLMYFKEHSNE